jgi:hypothetical protein
MSLLPYASLTHRRKAYRAGDVVLLSSQTATNSATISFTSDITSTYGEYIFKWYNVNPATDEIAWSFQGSTDGGSNYNVTITSSAFNASNQEDDASAVFGYRTAEDQRQGTAFQSLNRSVNNDADASCVGELHVFNPSSTTYVKQFYSESTEMGMCGGSCRFMHAQYVAGYFNTTSALNAFQFKCSSGNFDGTVKLWGVL